MPHRKRRSRHTRKYKGKGGTSRTRKVQRGGGLFGFGSSSTPKGPSQALDATGQRMRVGTTYRCTPLIGSNRVLKVTSVNDAKKTVDGTDADGRTSRTSITASNCRVFQPALSNIRDKAGIAVRLNQDYICKGYTGFAQFRASGIDGALGKEELVGFDSKNTRRNFPAKDCMQVPAGGITGSNSTNQALKVGDTVTCKPLAGDAKTLKITEIKGFPGKEAEVNGLDIRDNAKRNFTAKVCKKVTGNITGTGKNGPINIGDYVTCKAMTAPSTFKVTAITGNPGKDANIFGIDIGDNKTTHNYAASKCEKVDLNTLTGLGQDEKPIKVGDEVTCKGSLTKPATFRVSAITGFKGKDATILGNDATGKKRSYDANECSQATDNLYGIGKDGKTINKDMKVTCKGLGPAKIFKVGVITGLAGKNARIKDSANKIDYPANECTIYNGPEIIGAGLDGTEIKEGDTITCKGMIGSSSTFVVQTIAGTAGEKAQIRGEKNETFTADQCVKPLKDGEEMFGTDKSGKRINKTAEVSCTGNLGTKTFIVDDIRGMHGKKADIIGPGGKPSYTANQCQITEGSPITGKGIDNSTIKRDDEVTCKGVGSAKTFKVQTVSGTEGLKANIRGMGNETYTADQCAQVLKEGEFVYGIGKDDKRIDEKSEVSCKGLTGTKNFIVDRIDGLQGKKATVFGSNGAIKYTAGDCTTIDGPAILGKGLDGKDIKKGDKVTCKGFGAPKTFDVQTVSGTAGPTAIIRGFGNEDYKASQCSQFVPDEEIYGLGIQGKTIKRGMDVTCTGVMGEKSFIVENITGVPGKKAQIIGTGGKQKYDAEKCRVMDQQYKGIGSDGKDFTVGNQVTCKGLLGEETFTVQIVGPPGGRDATVRSTSNDTYPARKCKVLTPEGAAASLPTTVIQVKLIKEDEESISKLVKILEDKGEKVLGLVGPDGKRVYPFDDMMTPVPANGEQQNAPANGEQQNAPANGQETQYGGKKKRSSKTQTRKNRKYRQQGGKVGRIFNIFLEGKKNQADIVTLKGEVNKNQQLTQIVDKINTVPKEPEPNMLKTVLTDKAAVTAVTASTAIISQASTPSANEDPTAITPNGKTYRNTEDISSPNNSNTIGMPPAKRGRANNNSQASYGQASKRSTANVIASGGPGLPSIPLSGRNIDYSFPKATEKKPDGVAFPISPGDYKGILSKNKYYIYFDPFFRTRAADIIVEIGKDEKTGPQYGFYRVTGNDQQILDGVRSIRGIGIGNVYDDIIDDLQSGIRDESKDLDKIESALENAKEAYNREVDDNKKGQINDYMINLQQQRINKMAIIQKSSLSLESFKALKAQEVAETQIGGRSK